MNDGTRRVILVAGALAMVVTVALAVLVLSGDGGAGTSAAGPPRGSTSAEGSTTTAPYAAAGRFFDAFERGDSAQAARVTDAEPDAAATLERARTGMAGATVRVVLDPAPEVPASAVEATVGAQVAWTLPAGEVLPGEVLPAGEAPPAGEVWTYAVSVGLRRAGDEWLVRWSPSVLHPALAAGQAPVHRALPAGGGLLDRDGVTLGQGPDRPQIVRDVERSVDDTRGADGWRIDAVDAAGTEVGVLFEKPATVAPTVTTTLDPAVQGAAQAAVDAQTRPAMIVAIDTPSGELLAVAQNAAVTGAGPLTARYPPGSAFKIVTAAAALARGDVGPDTPVACPASATIGQRTVRNNGFGIESLPLRSAFARSCNTTFAELAAELPVDGLTVTAEQFGIGVPLEMPGALVDTGAVPVPLTLTAQVEAGFGQGEVLVSPLGMALVAATVESARTVTPELLRGAPAVAQQRVRAPSGEVLRALRPMMREVVTDGTATELSGLGPVAGKTGTAEFDGGAHGWFVGYRGDLAFAVFVEGAGSSSVAVTTTAAFLGPL